MAARKTPASSRKRRATAPARAPRQSGRPAAKRAPHAAPPPAADTAESLLSRLASATGLPPAVVQERALKAFATAHGLLGEAAVAPSASASARPAAAAPAAAGSPARQPPAPPPAAAEPPAVADEPPPLAPEVRLYVHGAGRPPEEMIADTYVIGSSNRSNLWVNLPKIETRHLRIIRDGTTYYAEDMNTEAGTFLVDGRRIEGRHPIAHEEVLLLAGYHRVRFYLLANH